MALRDSGDRAVAGRKNILIFSDGTGQAGGLSPDQRLSNVYKLYRATRIGPDSGINPEQQVAFYDPGLGTQPDAGKGWALWLTIRRFLSSATGAGLGRNIADCYEAIIKHYEPGDHIFLLGFSRGAYTARCVGGVLALCGVPERLPDGGPIPRWGRTLRAIADEAVHQVYEHGNGRKRSQFADERTELARRFRAKYGCDVEGHPNAAPYFIGVFDPVAALGVGGLRRYLTLSLAALVLATPPLLLGWAAQALGLWSMSFVAATVALAEIVVGGAMLARARLKTIWAWPTPHQFRWHWTGWRFKFYDTELDAQVRFARSALAIDERRRDFQYVPWGAKKDPVQPQQPGQPERFQQIWFAGNHSDIGGSYPEDESRLSDISLQWMCEQMENLPHPAFVDHGKLNTFPRADGPQHCEIESFKELYPGWWPAWLRRGWAAQIRYRASGAVYHPTVLERLSLPSVQDCASHRPYRPAALSKDPALARYYNPQEPGA